MLYENIREQSYGLRYTLSVSSILVFAINKARRPTNVVNLRHCRCSNNPFVPHSQSSTASPESYLNGRCGCQVLRTINREVRWKVQRLLVAARHFGSDFNVFVQCRLECTEKSVQHTFHFALKGHCLHVGNKMFLTWKLKVEQLLLWRNLVIIHRIDGVVALSLLVSDCCLRQAVDLTEIHRAGKELTRHNWRDERSARWWNANAMWTEETLCWSKSFG